MNLHDKLYNQFYLVQEMYESVKLFKTFKHSEIDKILPQISKAKQILITGEGSSRIFPAKNCIYKDRKSGTRRFITEGATQAHEYDLDDVAIFGVSNSGKTKEVINLLETIKHKNSLFCLVSYPSSPMAQLSSNTYVLKSGEEKAVAATKSVMEQALYFQCLQMKLNHHNIPNLHEVAEKIETVLNIDIPKDITQILQNATMVYWSGRNNGVAEELRLKTNEILHKKADYLEGTYIVHGVEEVMQKGEVVILIDPFKEEWEKIQKTIGSIGVKIIAISTQKTIFSTIVIPEDNIFSSFLQLATGWNLLAEAAIKLGINPDTAERARKVGNSI